MTWGGLLPRVCFAGLLVAIGCSEPAIDSESLADWFVRTQGTTETPHGPIDVESVHQDGDAVIYRTDGGGAFRQEYRADSDGGFERVGDPQPTGG